MTKIRRQTQARIRSSERSKSVAMPLIMGVVILAIAVVGLLMWLGNQSQQAGGPIDTSRFPAKGDPNAPVTIIEFSDYG